MTRDTSLRAELARAGRRRLRLANGRSVGQRRRAATMLWEGVVCGHLTFADGSTLAVKSVPEWLKLLEAAEGDGAATAPTTPVQFTFALHTPEADA